MLCGWMVAGFVARERGAELALEGEFGWQLK